MCACSQLLVTNDLWFFCTPRLAYLGVYSDVFSSFSTQGFWQNHRSGLSHSTAVSLIGQIILETVFVSFESIVMKFLCVLACSNLCLIYLCSLLLVQSFPCFQWLLQRTELEVSFCLHPSICIAWFCSPRIFSQGCFLLLQTKKKISLGPMVW